MPRLSKNTDSPIFKIRTSLGLSQEEFANKIGLTKSGISAIESGKRELTKSNEKLICSTFNVNEMWLHTGEGEMFNTNADDELAYMMGALLAEDDPWKKEFITHLLRLDKSEWKVIKNLMTSMLAEKE